MDLIHVDVSDHQDSAFTDAYPHKFGMFRAASEWDRPDKKAPANLTWCTNARATGKLVNFGVYVIPGNVPNDAIMGRLAALNVPTDCVIMMDVESWGGLITGDHSGQFNTLADTLRARQQGRPDLVWGYLNPNVDLGLWPRRPAWLGFIQPAYGHSTPPDPKGLNRIGWQYTNGTQNGTTNPSSSDPFGRCDHNTMYINYPLPGADVPLTQAEIDAVADAAAAKVWAKLLTASIGNKTTQRAELFLANTNERVSDPSLNGGAVTDTDLNAAVTKILNAIAGIPGGGGPVSYTMTGTLNPKATP